MAHKLFVNLPVRDLQRSMDFFRALGFSFDARFQDETAASMKLSDDAWFMLLTEPRFRDFTRNRICDTSTHTECFLAFACDSREEVDRLVDIAIQNGARLSGEPMDLGFMYQRTFYDLDGHHWEPFWMDSAQPG